jgi:hypothetical protein
MPEGRNRTTDDFSITRTNKSRDKRKEEGGDI